MTAVLDCLVGFVHEIATGTSGSEIRQNTCSTCMQTSVTVTVQNDLNLQLA